MIELALSLALAQTIQNPRLTLSDDQLVARFEAECTGAAKGAECFRLRSELEVRLLADLRQMLRVDAPVDREVIQAAVAAEFPFLAIFGLEQMQQAESDEDEAALLWALDHPSPAVRNLARSVAQRSQRPRLQAELAWGSGGNLPRSENDLFDEDDWADGLLPQAPRSLAEFGMPDLPSASYRFSMSDDNFAVFATPDSPERVLAVVAKGKKVKTAEEIGADMPEPDSSEVEKIGQEMQGVTDPVKLIELNEKLAKAMEKMYAPMMQNLVVRDPEGRYFEVTAPGEPRRNHRVGVGRDERLGTTLVWVLLK